jgi:hypothetical protein
MGPSLLVQSYLWLLTNKPIRPASAALEDEWLSATADTTNTTQQLLSVDCSSPDADCAIHQENMAYPSIFLLQVDKPTVPYRGPRRAAAYVVAPLTKPTNT